jgi:hypothetical protein
MRNVELTRQSQKLRTIIGRVGPACGGDIELQAHWAKYICVLVAGLLENALKEIYKDYVASRSAQNITNYVCAQLKAVRNPKAGKFLEVAKSFDPTWEDELKQYLDQDGRGDAIDSIMTNRHLIAHGQSSNITLVRIREYLDKATEVIDYVESQVH